MISQVRVGLAAGIATINGLNVDPNGLVQGAITPPTAVILPGEPYLEYSVTMGDEVYDLRFTVLLIVGAAYSPENQQALDNYLEPTGAMSIRAAVHSHVTTAYDYAIVRRAFSIGMFEYAGQQYYGAQLTVEVACSV